MSTEKQTSARRPKMGQPAGGKGAVSAGTLQPLLIEWLRQFERAGAEGLALCAPNAVKGQVNALSYNPKGELKENDKLSKCGLPRYLEGAGEFEVKVTTTTKGGKVKEKVITVQRQRISEEGRRLLREYQEKLLQGEQERKRKQALELEGIQQAVRDQVKTGENIDRHLQEVGSLAKDVPQKVARELDSVKAWLHEECEGQRQELSAAIDGFLASSRQELQKWQAQLEQFGKQWRQRLDQAEDKWQQHLEQVSGQCQQMPVVEKIVELRREIADMSKVGAVWSQAVQESPLLRQVAAPLPAPGGDLPLRRSGSSIAGDWRQAVSERLLPLLPVEFCKEIADLYRELCAAGFDIGPGQLNDLLWDLSQQGRVILERCDRSLSELRQPQHAILQVGPMIFTRVRRPGR